MHWITILGIIVIGIGTFLTYYGSTLSSAKDKEEITKKIDSFDNKLESIKKENVSDTERSNQLAKVENEFQEWAKDFVQNKSEKKVQIDKTALGIKEVRLLLSKKWRNLYLDFMQSLNEMVTAYSQTSGDKKIRILENPKLPDDIFDATQDSYRFVLKFNDNLYWIIWLQVKEPIDDEVIPTIHIVVAEDIRDVRGVLSWGDLAIIPLPKYQSFNVTTSKKFEKAGFNVHYELKDDNRDLAIEILKQAFEYQILMIEK